MQISDSSSRILAGLLEARTGQQLTMSRRWRIETALSALLRERGIATLDELITILVMGKRAELVATGRRGVAQQRNLFLPRPRAVRPARSAMRFPSSLQRRAKSKRLRIWSAGCSTGPGSLFAGDAVRRGAGEVARLDHRHSRHRRVDAAASIARAPAPTRQFEVQRGLGINQMIRWFEEMRRRLARGRAAAQAGPLPGPQSPRSRRRIPATSTSSCAATSCSISAPRRRRWPSTGSPRRWPRTAG